MERRSAVVCALLALQVGCGGKKEESTGGLDPMGQGGMSSGGQTGITLTGGTAGLAGMATGGMAAGGMATGGMATVGGTGGSAAGAPGVTCTSPAVPCNEGCVSPDGPTLGNCTLLVADDDDQRGFFHDMALDNGELFASANKSIYRIDLATGALTTLTSVPDSGTFELKVSGDTIYFFDEVGSDMTLMSVPRTGGTAKALTGVVNRVGVDPQIEIGGGYVAFASGPDVLSSVPLAGGTVTTQSGDLGGFNDFAAAPDGTFFITNTIGATTTLQRASLPFPFTDTPATIATARPRVMHAENDYVYFFDTAYERVPTAGGAVETLAAVGAVSLYRTPAITDKELVYATSDGVELVSASGGAPVPIGKLRISNLSKLLVDADHVYAMYPFELLVFSR